MKRLAGERERLSVRRGERLPDVLLRRPRPLAVPHGKRQGSRVVSHRPVPARAAAGEGAQRPGPAAAQAGLGLGRAAQAAGARAVPAGHVRIGYARASAVRQSLDTQTDSLRAAGVTRIFAEKISTRAVTRPELDKAVALAREMRASGVAVTIVVHEHKRLGRGIELAALAEQLRAADIGLEFLTGELQGSHDPSGIVFTVLAALSGMEREYIRDRTLEGHEAARARGKAIGGAAVTDEAMLAVALHRAAAGPARGTAPAGRIHARLSISWKESRE